MKKSVLVMMVITIALTGCTATELESEQRTVNTKNEVSNLEEDLNTTGTKEILTDLQYHKENWTELGDEWVEEAQMFRTLKRISSREQDRKEEFATSVRTGHGDIVFNLQKVQYKDKTIVIPQNFDDFPLEFAFIREGEKLLVAAENGLWIVDSSNSQPQKISSSLYNGKTYEDFAQESIDLHGKNYVSWNSGILPSPDSTRLVYNSNKHDMESGGSALFMFDLATGDEAMVADTVDVNYLINGWLNSESVICTKYKDTILSKVLVNLDGEEIDLNLPEESVIYSVQDGRIAYITHRSNSGDEFHVARVDETGTLQAITSTRIEGKARMRAGIEGFSPDHSYAAFLYVPDESPEKRYIKVVNLNKGTIVDINSLPDDINPTANIIEFSWINENTLFIEVQEKVSGVKKKSDWTYSLQ
ncbi:hypothetical protein [Paenibacillus paridis]|uniref:hypothetical protein n=1 Tax=Paenibacillus paridis TaxID=2583376 RepID=UPI00111CDD42|nr:hypothetical protein [Paenibacillus paridis]